MVNQRTIGTAPVRQQARQLFLILPFLTVALRVLRDPVEGGLLPLLRRKRLDVTPDAGQLGAQVLLIVQILQVGLPHNESGDQGKHRGIERHGVTTLLEHG